VEGRRQLVALGAEQALEPVGALDREGIRAGVARLLY